MSFVCSIHGYYSPTPGTTLAICPECQAQGSPILANEGLAELEAARSEITRLRASLAAAEKNLDAGNREYNRLLREATSKLKAAEALHARIEAIAVELEERAEAIRKRSIESDGLGVDVAITVLEEAASLIHTTLGSSDE